MNNEGKTGMENDELLDYEKIARNNEEVKKIQREYGFKSAQDINLVFSKKLSRLTTWLIALTIILVAIAIIQIIILLKYG